MFLSTYDNKQVSKERLKGVAPDRLDRGFKSEPDGETRLRLTRPGSDVLSTRGFGARELRQHSFPRPTETGHSGSEHLHTFLQEPLNPAFGKDFSY